MQLLAPGGGCPLVLALLVETGTVSAASQGLCPCGWVRLFWPLVCAQHCLVVLSSWVRCSLFSNCTLNSLEEACWCESFYRPLEERRGKRGGDSGVGHGARREGGCVFGPRSPHVLFPVRLPLVGGPLGRVKAWTVRQNGTWRFGSQAQEKRSAIGCGSGSRKLCVEWAAVPFLVETGRPV